MAPPMVVVSNRLPWTKAAALLYRKSPIAFRSRLKKLTYTYSNLNDCPSVIGSFEFYCLLALLEFRLDDLADIAPAFSEDVDQGRRVSIGILDECFDIRIVR